MRPVITEVFQIECALIQFGGNGGQHRLDQSCVAWRFPLRDELAERSNGAAWPYLIVSMRERRLPAQSMPTAGARQYLE